MTSLFCDVRDGLFEDHLRKKAVPKENHGLFKKWLRYYLHFCEKYQFSATRKESLPEFLGKLREKRQTKAQQEQAACAIGVFYDFFAGKLPPPKAAHGPGKRPYPKGLPYQDYPGIMIYTHTVKSVTIKEAKSPLDF